MDNERIMILKMLEEGKINVSDATKLLGALEGEPEPKKTEKPKASGTSNANNSQEINFSDATKDIGKRFAVFAKEMEPKLEKFTEKLVEKTISMTDSLSKSLAETGRTASPVMKTAPPMKNATEKGIELTVEKGMNTLWLIGHNGDVEVKGYNGDKITIKLYYKPRALKPKIDLTKSGEKYFLNYDESQFENVFIHAFVPANMFHAVNIQTNNGELKASSMIARKIEMANMNGNIELKKMSADEIFVDCGNGALRIEEIKAKEGKFENTNGEVYANKIDVEKMSLTSFNGEIVLDTDEFPSYHEYNWRVETCNAKICLNLPGASQYGYEIKARTVLSNVKISLPELTYTRNERAHVEAETSGSRNAKRIKLSLETSNNTIIVQ